MAQQQFSPTQNWTFSELKFINFFNAGLGITKLQSKGQSTMRRKACAKIRFALLLLSLSCAQILAQENSAHSKFEQLYQELQTPGVYRTASGAPGHLYWQQRADYDMRIELDDDSQQLRGEETITYYNNSPDALTYLWVQLDQNLFEQNSDYYTTRTSSVTSQMSFKELKRLHNDFEGGFKIAYVQDRNGRDLPYTINKTMMRVDLPQPLLPKNSFAFKIKWWHNINERAKVNGRSGFEHFPEDGNNLYVIAQFFPRMAVYSENQGWQNKQFLGSGEFTLPFGNYSVSLTVPADHVLGATGVLQNAEEVLSAQQQARLQQARTASAPVMIVTPAEALAAEKGRSPNKKTWQFKAENVRDFAFATSRKFIWDAMGVKFGDRTVLAMSYYPKEGNPLWEQYSTKVVAHTLRSYSKFTFDYPYPVAISVHTDRIGMEYPMICFNGGRPERDGTYSERTKYGMISVIIHEVGHNYFPMIVNSDERQWTWMDEGLNSFVQYLAEQEWDRNYPSRRGPAANIIDYMKGDKSALSPIMTNSESIIQFGNNAYGKPATALNILRETVMGRELFDFAFKQYAQRWMFKHPTPEDLFRTMEDASGVDLDWFWRGWFYGVEKVDVGLAKVKWFKVDTQNPELEKPVTAAQEKEKPEFIGELRNRSAIAQSMIEKDPALQDFYNKYDPFEVSALDQLEFEKYLASLDADEKAMLQPGGNYYEIEFINVGGLLTPLILEFELEDGSKIEKHIPAEIWRYNDKTISKIFIMSTPVKSITLDPHLETADVDMSNNYWPPRATPTRFQLFKEREREAENPMQRERRAKELEKKEKTE